MSAPTKGGRAYDRGAFAAYLERLLDERNETMREASLSAGLDHSALSRFITQRQRPTRESCIALADHFRLNPNEVLTRAGYDAMHFFDRSLVDPEALPVEVSTLARYLSRIQPLARRRQLCQAIHTLIALATQEDEEDSDV